MSIFPDSIVRQLDQKIGEHPSIMDWGAVCDGVTDDSAAWGLAVAAISTNSYGYLFVPGTSAISNVEIPSNVHVYGHPGKSGITTTGTYTTSRGLLNITGTNWSLEGLAFDGQVTTPVGVSYAGFTLDAYSAVLYDKSSIWLKPGSGHGRIHNCEIFHSGGYGILVDSDTADTTDIQIDHNYFHDNRPHLFGTDTADLVYGAWTGGIWIRGDCRSSAGKVFACRNIKVTDNQFKRCSGEGVWMHSKGFDTHHTNVVINNNQFLDMGLDPIQVGNLFGGSVVGNSIHRAGYTTIDDTSPSIPRYLPPAFCVGIDSTGFAEAVTIEGNALLSVNGEFIDLDGLRRSSVKGNTCVIPDAGSVQYIEDQIAAYGTASANITKGIQTGNTSINGGAADVAITGNTIVNCSTPAIVVAYGKRCLVSGNSISHPATAASPPIEIFALNTNGTEWQAFDNKITANLIHYPAANFCIFEGGDNAAYTGCTNTIWNNHLTGTNLGEFLRISSSASIVGAFFSSNDSSLTAQSLTAATRVGHGTSGALQYYSYSGSAGPGYVAQLADTGPGWNVGGSSGKGYLTTGTRVAIGTLNDFASSGKVAGDAFFIIAHDSYLDSEANSLPASSGLLRYTPGTGTASNTGNLEISTAVTTAGTRVWQSLTFGSSTAPGADTQILFNDTGAFGASARAVFNKTLGALTLAATTNTIAALVVGTGFVQSAAGYLTSATNFNAFQAAAGGFYGTSATLDQELYLKAISTSTALASPGAYGALAYNTGSKYWYWNGAAFATVDFSASASVPGANTQLIFNDSSSFGASSKLTFNKTTGQLITSGTAGTAEIATTNGYIQSAQGLLSNYNSYQTINIPNGGVYTSSLRTIAYLALAQASGDPSTPTSGDSISDGVIYYNTAGSVRVRVGGGFTNLLTGPSVVNSIGAGAGISISASVGTVNITNTGVLSLQGSTGVLNLIAGTGVGISGLNISIGQAIGTANSPTFANLTLTGNLTVSGFGQFTGNVNSTGGGLATAGTIRLTNTGALQNISTINTAGNITTAGAVIANIYDINGGFFGQDAISGLVCGARTLFFKGGILYAFV